MDFITNWTDVYKKNLLSQITNWYNITAHTVKMGPVARKDTIIKFLPIKGFIFKLGLQMQLWAVAAHAQLPLAYVRSLKRGPLFTVVVYAPQIPRINMCATDLLQLVEEVVTSLLCEALDLPVHVIQLTQLTKDRRLRLTTPLHRRIHLWVQFLNHRLLVVQASLQHLSATRQQRILQ